jgi:hypothetical protein
MSDAVLVNLKRERCDDPVGANCAHQPFIVAKNVSITGYKLGAQKQTLVKEKPECFT